MEINESQQKILKAVAEARKMLQKEDSVSGDGNATGDNSVSQIGADPVGVDSLNTATKETKPLNIDQVGLARGKLREKKLGKKAPKVK
jgi:hypothetical protein